jgi:mannose-1-phosphate guanylyltransferase
MTKSSNTLIPIILCGGAGSRLWPLSQPERPKSFISLDGTLTLYQETLNRLSGLNAQPPIILCHEAHRFIAAENSQALGIAPRKIILEPDSRNTAPYLLVMPSDHFIEDGREFVKSVAIALQAATQGKIVTLGVKPTFPHTGYGYIKYKMGSHSDAHDILHFKEKPDLETALTYLLSEDYLWNSGIICVKASVIIGELERTHPEIVESVRAAVSKGIEDDDFFRLNASAFATCPAISIDYAIMEHTKNGAVVILNSVWNDIGSWDAVWQVSPKDKDGNSSQGSVATHDCRNNYIIAKDKTIAVMGMEDIVVIETEDAILIANKKQSQNIKTLVDKIRLR